jgi:talin
MLEFVPQTFGFYIKMQNLLFVFQVSQVLAALQAGSRGTQACINAASTVSGIIGDLDTTIMFATAGTLHAEGEGETFADHREQILKTAKALVEDTKTLVAGAASSQEQLAVAAQNAVTTIVQLAEVVKYGAASLGSNNPESQVSFILTILKIKFHAVNKNILPSFMVLILCGAGDAD